MTGDIIGECYIYLISRFASDAGKKAGVDDEGTVRGVEGHNRLKSQVQSVARSADPPISVELESMGDMLAIRVPAPAIDVSEHWVTVTIRRPELGGEGSGATSKGPGRDQVGTK